MMTPQQKSLGRGQTEQGFTSYQNTRTDHNGTHAEQQFRAAAMAHGIVLPANLIADEVIHRFHDPRDKSGSKNAWYVLYLDGHAAAAFGSWKTGESHTWRATGGSDVVNADEFRRQIEVARIQRDQALAEGHRKAAIEARHDWSQACQPSSNSPYPCNKKMPPIGLRQTRNVLLAKMINIHGEIVNLQRIYPDGQKRFLAGGQVAGAFSLLGDIDPMGRLFVVEGWATGVTVHLDTGAPVACAMNCRNLLSVTSALRNRYPQLDMVIAGDDDRQTHGNPGRTKAIEAAIRTQSKVVFPNFCQSDCNCSDYNDVHCCRLGRGEK